MKGVYAFLTIFAAFTAQITAFAQNQTDTLITFNPADYEASIYRLDVNDVDIDGELNEQAWKKAKKFDNFFEAEPREKARPNAETEAFLFYDDDNLYIGFICYEPDVGKIRMTFTERDRIFSDDFAGIIFDTYNEGKQAYEIFANPYGIQGDLLWYSTGNEDENFDAIWTSAAKVYKDRWTLEIAIPFKSLRFPNKKEQVWKFHLVRNRPRVNREQILWVPVSRDVPTLFTQSGTLKGITGVKGGNNFEVLPYALGSQQGSISDYSNANSEFNNEKIKGQFGLNLKYGITSNLTADLAVNPDFSQVESDADQIDVNNTYALFYPEKRPYFIEGGSIFETPIRVVYTRSIYNPLFAFKLTGKIGKTEIGYNIAYDQKTSLVLPFREYSNYLLTDRENLSNILRLKYTIKDENYLGLTFTDRQVNKDTKKFIDTDGFNRVFGFDGNFRFLENYSFTFQVLKSISKEISYPEYSNSDRFDRDKYTSALDGEEFSGYRTTLEFNRSARHWNFNVQYNDAAPVIRFDNGFIANNDYRVLETYQGYTFYPDSKVLDRIELSGFGYIRHSYESKPVEQFFQPQLYLRFANQIYVNSGFFFVNNELYGGKFHKEVRRGWINVNMNSFSFLTGGFYISMGKSIVRNSDPFVGYVKQFEIWNTVKPIDRITLENSWVYYELLKSYGGEKLYAGYIFRNKTYFQFSQALNLRLIFQYNSFDHIFDVNPLISYKLNPFTIFYIGSTHTYSDLEVPNSPSKYTLSGRQYFLKLQYLWRL